jgi:hypothetical protein
VRNRVLSLRYAGIYIADGTHLMTAVADGELPFEPVGEAHPLPADIAFPPSDTHTHAHRGAQARARAVPSRAPAIPKTRISDSAKGGIGGV